MPSAAQVLNRLAELDADDVEGRQWLRDHARESDRWKDALHEAAHVIAAITFRINLVGAGLTPRESGGRQLAAWVEPDRGSLNKATPFARATFIAAGPACEARLNRRDVLRFGEADGHCFQAAIDLAPAGERDDLRRQAMSRAQSLVCGLSGTIGVMATELIARQEMSGAEIFNFIMTVSLQDARKYREWK
jgi:hypothetical protein